MAVFPKLKTGAAAQYPLSVEAAYETRVANFLDLSEQRFRERPGRVRRWVVDLRLLSHLELEEVERFFDEQRGGFGVFEFEDPTTGSIVTSCRFDQDAISVDERGDFDAAARLVIVEDQ